MGYELRPKSGIYHSAAEVESRLRGEFDVVVTDPAAGATVAKQAVEAIRRANPVVFLGRAEAMQAWARRLENLAFGEALRFKVGDRKGEKVSFTVLPDSNIIVAAEPDEGPNRRLLLERCARALDYELSII